MITVKVHLNDSMITINDVENVWFSTYTKDLSIEKENKITKYCLFSKKIKKIEVIYND